MTVPWTQVVPLAADHELEGFRSGRESVDIWLREKAVRSAHDVATSLCLDDSGSVVAFFALMTIVVPTEGLSGRLRRGADARGLAPAVLLAQMGLDRSRHGSGHGRSLFLRAAREAAICARVARVPLLIVDAADEGLVAFYSKFGMRRIENSTRLVARLDKVSLQ